MWRMEAISKHWRDERPLPVSKVHGGHVAMLQHLLGVSKSLPAVTSLCDPGLPP
jgi:hypothetical protein